jgi:phospholipase/carboxylesterase
MLEHLVVPLGLDDVHYVLPAAEGGSWYTGRFFDAREVNREAIERALDACERAVAGLVAADTPPERIVLAGFSQGACVLADFLALRPRAYAGVALLTGTLTGPEGDVTPVRPLGGVRVFLCASEHDAWIGPEHVRATARALAEAGGEVALRFTDEREHGISAAAVAGTRELLRGVPSGHATA